MRKLLLLMFALLTGVSGAWADGTWNIESGNYTTDGWTLMENNVPSGITDLGNYTPYYRTEEITLTTAASLEVRFKYTSGDHRLDILGVDVLDGSNNIVAQDYHVGYTGGNMDKNTYLLNALDAGTYTIRYIICGYDATNSKGNITINTIKYADSFANISQWYIIRIHANQAHYMYYDSSNTTTRISFTSSTADINNNNYLWGFVKNGSGVSIYNKAAGESLAIDNATPSTMSNEGTSAAFTLGTVAAGNYGWDADAFFSVYKTAGTYLNYQGGNLQRWSDADAGSNFMIYAVDDPTNLTATLTDVNGATYTVNYEGFAGMTIPTLTGCYGYTLTNGSWSGKSYSATINFPFRVSSNSVTNYTYIGSFHNKNNFSSEDFLWRSEESAVKVGNKPNNTQSGGVYTVNEKYKWAITPTITTAGAITFTIKNASTGKYINSTAAERGHSNTVSLSETASYMTYNNTTTTNTCSPIRAFYLPSTKMYLSVNSVNGGTDQQVGVWNAVHDGISVGFYTPADFATLDANLIAACQAFMPYSNIIGSELGQYSGATSSEMSSAYTTATTTSPLTAAQLTSLTTTLADPSTKLTLNIPTKPIFMRIRSSQGAKGYMTTASANGRATFTEKTDASTIYLWGSDKKLVSYGNGLAYNQMYVPQANGADGVEYNVVAAVSGNIGQYSISCKDNNNKTIYLYSTGSGNADRNTESTDATWKQRNSFTLEAVTSLPVTITAAGWATAYFPVAVTIPTNVKAYRGTINNGYVHLDEIDGTIPAECAVVLSGAAGTYNFEVTTTDETAESNDFKGEVATFVIPSTDTYYTLRADSDGSNPGFFTKEAGKNIQGFRAYLKVDGASQVRALMFHEITGVNIPVELIQSENAYDLQGRRVQTPDRGLYIINGKKVIF